MLSSEITHRSTQPPEVEKCDFTRFYRDRALWLSYQLKPHTTCPHPSLRCCHQPQGKTALSTPTSVSQQIHSAGSQCLPWCRNFFCHPAFVFIIYRLPFCVNTTHWLSALDIHRNCIKSFHTELKDRQRHCLIHSLVKALHILSLYTQLHRVRPRHPVEFHSATQLQIVPCEMSQLAQKAGSTWLP